MTPLIVLAVQCTFSLFVFYLLSRWYLLPRITKSSRYEVLAVLLVVNVFRYLPLSLYMPGQVSTDFPEHVKEIVAHGDFASGVLALIALLLLKSKSKLAIPFAWIFSMVSILDMILALFFAMSEKVYELPLGVNYFTVAVYVPMLMVTQAIILKLLIVNIRIQKSEIRSKKNKVVKPRLLPTIEHRLWTIDYRPWTMDYGLRT